MLQRTSPIINIQRFLPLIVAYVLLQMFAGQGVAEWLTTFTTFFTAILLEAMPFMLVGSIISGAIEVFVPRETLARWVPRNRFVAVLLFGLMGIAFPICECGIVPVIRRLLKKGVPLSCGITYLLAAPIVQPIVFASTMVAFMGSWRIALYRVIGGYAIAVIVGTLSIFYLDPQAKQHLAFKMPGSEEAHEELSCHEHDHSHEHADDCGCGQTDCGCGEEALPGPRAKTEYVLRHAAEDFLSTGSYLIFGALIAAAMQTFVSQDMLAKIGHGPILGPLVMMAMAFVLSLCSEADAFVATSFSQFTIASRMAFLVMGPMVDIKLLAMYNGFLSKKATAFIFGLASALALCYALLLQKMGV